jgi:MazG family protein
MIDSPTPSDPAAAFGRMLELIRTLRSENGCPWDKKQTPHSIHPYILEEYHELVQAMNEGKAAEITDELGDLLFLVVFLGYMFEQERVTTLADVLDRVTQKMTRRHPHVFGDVQATTPEDVIDNWAKIKASEESIAGRKSILDGIPRSLPALVRAQKLSRRAAKVGFDWIHADDVLAKVDEEFQEFKDAVAAGRLPEIREELGDLLFVLVNAARHLGVNGEIALNDCSDKFERRFHHIEDRLSAAGKTLNVSDLAEMDRLWDEAKALEKKPGQTEPTS